MKNCLASLILLCFPIIHFAQVGVNTTNPKALFDITVSNPSSPSEIDGLLIPRVSAFPSNDPGNNQEGLLIYLTTSVGSNTPGFYYWNYAGNRWDKLLDSNTSINSDHDFYRVGSTDNPNDIYNNIYTFGNLAVGKNTANYKLDINETFSSSAINVVNSSTNATSSSTITGISTEVSANIFNNKWQRGIYNRLDGDGNNNKTGVYNEISGISQSSRHGIYNAINNNSDSIDYGVYNYLTSSSNTGSNKYGMYSYFFNDGATTNCGVLNFITGSSSRSQTGTYNYIINNSSSLVQPSFGVRNILQMSSPGPQYGVYNLINGTGNADRTGVVNELSGPGTGDKIGTSIIIDPTAGGDHIGLQSTVLKPGGYAANFRGSVSIGTELLTSTTPNHYVFPTSRGTNNQIMQTDGSGNLNWQDLPESTDDQIVDEFNLNGNLLELSLEDDGLPTQTVDLSVLKNWMRTGTEIDVANSGDDLHFSSDQTSITFPQSTGSPAPMLYMFDGGFSNANKMVVSHSSTYNNWGLEYRDADDSFHFLSAGISQVAINLNALVPLVVNGSVQASDFISSTTTYPDYVFEAYFNGCSTLNEQYKFMNLHEVEQFIKEYGHLPGVTPYEDVERNQMQVNLSQATITNLEKIEELFLYTLELKQENAQLKENQKRLQKRLEAIEKHLLEKN